MDTDLRASLLAGVLAGLAGLLAFTLLHVVLVGPLWILLGIGFLPAILAGVFVGWAYHELLEAEKLPERPWRGPALGALLWFTLVPLELLALVRGPAADVDPVAAMRSLGPEMLLPALAGAIAGWVLTRRWRPTFAVALGAFLLAAPVGGTLVALGASPIGPAIFVGMLFVNVVAGLVLAEAQPLVARATDRRGASAPGEPL